MAKFVWIAAALQLASAVAAHFSTAVLNLTGIPGTLIAFAVAIVYGARVPRSATEAARGGLAVGVVGSVIAGTASVLMGDQTWILLTWAPPASGLAGCVGGLLGRLARSA